MATKIEEKRGQLKYETMKANDTEFALEQQSNQFNASKDHFDKSIKDMIAEQEK